MISHAKIHSLTCANLLMKLNLLHEGKKALVYWIVDEVKKLKDKLCRVWIKNHNIKAILASIKLFVVANLVVQC